MTGMSSRVKGANAEREAAELLVAWATPVYAHAGLPPPVVRRNLEQVLIGGYDLTGFDWLAIEVKRQESLNLESWWAQACRQAGPEQIPFLMWRQSRRPWWVRVRGEALHKLPDGSPMTHTVAMTLALPDAQKWFQYALWSRIAPKPAVETGRPERGDSSAQDRRGGVLGG